MEHRMEVQKMCVYIYIWFSSSLLGIFKKEIKSALELILKMWDVPQCP